MKLLLTQRNNIFDIIIEQNLDPKDFNFNEELITQNEIVTRLRYKETKYYFIFRQYGYGLYLSLYSPGQNSLEDEERNRTWRSLLATLKKWLRNLEREINVIDKWNDFKTGLQYVSLNFNSENENEKFSSEELNLIDFKINNIKQEIGKLALPENTINTINLKLDNLNEKAAQLSKTDWKELFIGGIIGLIFSLTITPELTNKIWEIIKHSFKQYILT